MRPNRPPAHSWLSLRVRILCVVVFLISLFAQPYVDDTQVAPPEDVSVGGHGFLLAEDGFLLKTSSLSEQGMRSAFSEGIIHTVERGETVASIGKASFLRPETIRWANNLSDKAEVKPGQKLLLLPVDGVLHKVKRGQNLKTIADLYDVSTETIAQQNKLRGGYLLAGQELIIPGGKPIVEIAAKPKPAIKSPSTTGVKVKFPQVKDYTIEPSYGVLQTPCNCFLTQSYSATHYGLDLQTKGGGPIFAAEAGTVIRAEYGWNGGYGNVIVIDHGNGIQTLYAHNKELYVVKGDTVARGQPISFMGNSGRVHGPTGIHLHFEVHVNGVKKNPKIYLQQ
jgi:LysM repeat protein